MISKKRFEELIEQDATIYYIFLGKIYDMLAKEYDYEWHGFEIIYETKEDAEFTLKYQNITRTETLSLPTFEELQSKREYFKSFTTNGITHCLVIEMPYKKDNGCILIAFNYNDNTHIKFNEPLTKENYLQACEICRKLFLGESV